MVSTQKTDDVGDLVCLCLLYHCSCTGCNFVFEWLDTINNIYQNTLTATDIVDQIKQLYKVNF